MTRYEYMHEVFAGGGSALAERLTALGEDGWHVVKIGTHKKCQVNEQGDAKFVTRHSLLLERRYEIQSRRSYSDGDTYDEKVIL